MKKTRTTPKQKASAPTNVYTIKDSTGNKIISTHHGTFATIALKLNDENHHRSIGTIRFIELEFHVIRQRSKHLLIKAQSYGFNHYILDNAKLFDTVVIQDEYSTWRIPRAIMLEQGKFMHFKNNGGFELQIFVSLELLNEYQIS